MCSTVVDIGGGPSLRGSSWLHDSHCITGLSFGIGVRREHLVGAVDRIAIHLMIALVIRGSGK
jgi:hypothetical protein